MRLQCSNTTKGTKLHFNPHSLFVPVNAALNVVWVIKNRLITINSNIYRFPSIEAITLFNGDFMSAMG